MTASKKLPSAELTLNSNCPPDLFAKSISTLFSNLRHICIDTDPVAEYLLRVQLSAINLNPESMSEKIFGYLGEDRLGEIYFFVNENQHLELQKILNQSSPCKV